MNKVKILERGLGALIFLLALFFADVYGEELNWQISTIDSKGDVGKYCSVAVDREGHPHISYADRSNFDIKYATNVTGSWDTIKIDDYGYSWTAIKIDKNNKAHIAHLTSSGDPDLKYITNKTGSWEPEVIAWYAWFSSIGMAIDRDNNIHFSYYQDAFNMEGYPKYCLNGSCSAIEPMPTKTSDYIRNHYTSLAVDKNGNVHISYYDVLNGDLKYANNLSGSWEISTIDNTGDVGQFNSIAADNRDYVHISYYSATESDLKYATNMLGTWLISTIDRTDRVGKYSSIALDSKNRRHISYYDETNGDLKYALSSSPRSEGEQKWFEPLAENYDWQPQDYVDSQAIKAGHFDAEKGRLVIEAHLIGGDPYCSKGEIFLDLRYVPGLECKVPIDMSQIEITVEVEVPEDFDGWESRPNGVQVFVKDEKWRAQYGTWLNITRGGRYTARLRPTTEEISGGYIAPGFDPTKIQIIGVKFGIGEGSSATYDGPLYITKISISPTIELSPPPNLPTSTPPPIFAPGDKLEVKEDGFYLNNNRWFMVGGNWRVIEYGQDFGVTAWFPTGNGISTQIMQPLFPRCK